MSAALADDDSGPWRTSVAGPPSSVRLCHESAAAWADATVGRLRTHYWARAADGGGPAFQVRSGIGCVGGPSRYTPV